MLKEDLINRSQLLANHFANPNSFANIIFDQIVNNYYKEFIPNGTLLDLGANVGLFSVYASKNCSTVISVEPTPSHITVLKDITKFYDNIDIVEAAIWKENTRTTFYESKENSTMNSLVESQFGTGTSYEVECKTISSILDEHNISTIDYVKMDIEGGEMLLVASDQFKIDSKRISTILVEAHDFSGCDKLKENGDIIEKILTSLDFKCIRKSIDCIIGIK